MNIQELATCAEEEIDVKVFIMNNGYLGMVRQWQELFWDRRYSHVARGRWPDFVKVAEGLRLHRHALHGQDDARRATCARRSTPRARSSSTSRVTARGERLPDDRARRRRARHGGLSAMGEPGTKELLSLEELEAAGGMRTGRKHVLSILVENKPGRPDPHRRPVRAARLQHRHAHGRADRRRAAVAHHADASTARCTRSTRSPSSCTSWSTC